MANFYTDNPSLKVHLTHPMMKKIVELKERNFADADKFDYAPQNFDDAMDSYDKVLEIVGEICGDIRIPALPGHPDNRAAPSHTFPSGLRSGPPPSSG